MSTTSKYKVKNTKDTVNETLRRTSIFIGDRPYKKYYNVYNALGIKQMDPFAIFLTKTEEIYKQLHGPLTKMKTIDKNILADKTRTILLNIRTHMIRSAYIDSRSVQEAIEVSSSLHELVSVIDLICGLGYFSNNFYSKVIEQIAILDEVLSTWFLVLKKYKELHNIK